MFFLKAYIKADGILAQDPEKFFQRAQTIHAMTDQ